MGLFEEEEEGRGISSDVVKVTRKGEDAATPGYYLRSVDTRKPLYLNDSLISVQKNKATHTKDPKNNILKPSACRLHAHTTISTNMIGSHCGSAVRFGQAFPDFLFYHTPPVPVPDVVRVLAAWWQNKKTKNMKI